MFFTFILLSLLWVGANLETDICYLNEITSTESKIKKMPYIV